jgi:hypothetical protein
MSGKSRARQRQGNMERPSAIVYLSRQLRGSGRGGVCGDGGTRFRRRRTGVWFGLVGEDGGARRLGVRREHGHMHAANSQPTRTIRRRVASLVTRVKQEHRSQASWSQPASRTYWLQVAVSRIYSRNRVIDSIVTVSVCHA